MLPEFTQHDFGSALDQVVEEIFESTGGLSLPVSAIRLAEALGLIVASDKTQSGRARFVRVGGFETNSSGGPEQGSIMVRPDPRPERLHWAVAHEIGEHVAYRVFSVLGIDPREAAPGSREQVANRLASRLLLPTAQFAADARQCDWDLVQLKGRYATASHELIARRMLDFDPPITITIFDHDRISFRSSNQAFRAPPLAAFEKACWSRAHESGEAQVDEDQQLKVQAWPIHEPDWKREILRALWQDWEC